MAVYKLVVEGEFVNAEVSQRARSMYARMGCRTMKALTFPPLFRQADGNSETLAWQSHLVDLRGGCLEVMGFFLDLETLDAVR